MRSITSQGRSPWRERLAPVLEPALDGLRMYPRTAGTIAVLVGGALAMALPIAWLTLWNGGHLDTSLTLQSLPPTGDAGPNYAPAARIEHTALLSFFRMLGAIGGATVLVALLAALGLAASRASQRTGEITIRRAIGAGRRLLYTGLLIEGAILAGITLLLAFGAGASGGRLAFSGWPDGSSNGNAEVGVFAALFASLLLVLGMLLPVIFAKRHALGEPTTRPVPLLLPTIQLGLSLIVLVSGALLARHASRLLSSADPSVAQGAVYALVPQHSPRSDRSRLYATLLERIGDSAGVSLASPGAIIGAGPTNRITTDCGNCMDGTIPARFKRVTVTQQIVSADSFHALGVGIVAGRVFNAQDSLGARQVAVVSRSLAQGYFQYDQPVGRMIRIQEAFGSRSEADEWYEVVGVVDDRRSEALGGALQPSRAIYLSILQQPPLAAELLVRTGDENSPMESLDLAVRQTLAADGALVTRTTSTALVARESERMSWFGWRIGLLGVVMLVIAAIGTATLMRSWVVSLRPELGLRRAVGATTGQLLRLMLGRAMKVGIAGTLFGVWFGPAVWDSLGATIYGIETWNPQLLAAIAALLVGATLAGVALPAVKATRATAASLLGSSEE